MSQRLRHEWRSPDLQYTSDDCTLALPAGLPLARNRDEQCCQAENSLLRGGPEPQMTLMRAVDANEEIEGFPETVADIGNMNSRLYFVFCGP